MNSNLNLGDLYRIKSLLIDSLATVKNEELALTKSTIKKISEMEQELHNWLINYYSTNEKVGA